MIKTGDVVDFDSKFVKGLAKKLIESDFREKTTHQLAKMINRMKFSDMSNQYHYYNCIRLIKLINLELSEYYFEKTNDPEKAVNHELIIYIKLLNSLVNKYHNA